MDLDSNTKHHRKIQAKTTTIVKPEQTQTYMKYTNLVISYPAY